MQKLLIASALVLAISATGRSSTWCSTGTPRSVKASTSRCGTCVEPVVMARKHLEAARPALYATLLRIEGTILDGRSGRLPVKPPIEVPLPGLPAALPRVPAKSLRPEGFFRPDAPLDPQRLLLSGLDAADSGGDQRGKVGDSPSAAGSIL